ncbi:LysR family transcriptional regulator [Rhodanobacter sp. MP7CTX1]|uniref:LysR family transcriptional regulator n=1 Tax=Rhodanobacter sp. MP7CTX1 TaxID=2723084 RepID=UPI001612CCCE|nr:LysR family transcriptional regulator [Rhodanobacter sp. MP7CTX1]MBB6187511.1 DNA-binding transcriptional LysR family regulator [Rhodanobacter sp. MP7CTX1]
MADDISDLRLLTQIVAAGSLTAAAERLESSLPAVSRRLASLERRLGVRLIDRHARKFQLTEEGGLLHDRALRIVADVDEAEAEASSSSSEAAGTLRIGAPLQIGRERIAPLIAQFALTHPKVHIDLILTDADMDVFEEDLDIMLRLRMPRAPNVVVRKILSGRRVVCASPAYLARHGEPKRPEDLHDHNCLTLIRGRRKHDDWQFVENGEPREIRVQGNMSTTSSDVIYAWMLAGHGLGLKVLWDIEEDLRQGRLLECLAAYACDVSDLYASYAFRRYVPSRMRVFLDFIAENLNPR